MHNLHDLEKRWLRYKIKSFIPYILLFIVTISIFIFYQFRSSFTITPTNKIKNIAEKNVSSTTKIDINKTKQIQQYQSKPSKIISKEANSTNENLKLKLKPSMDFIQNLELSDDMQQHKTTTINTNKSPRAIEKKVPTHKAKVQHLPKKVQKQDEQTKLIIKREETQNDLQEIIKRFKNNKNPALSLFIAKKYYEIGNYSQSYNYALITNELNKDIEKSWIIFAKSLVKLNKKEDAIKMLKNYINYSHSSNATILLNDIRTGKFK
ncbi:hypothetical protein [Sulfurimonas sp.]|uniref:hypothetical protein n=1 Tax=Sulfurimonas sp. TaxID=2022749 RepID=UPI00261F247C|nr:hypothetical protein [Sulfurimonas sp.]